MGLEIDGRQEVRLRRVEPGSLNLGRAIDIDELLQEIEDPDVPLDLALARVESTRNRPDRWSPRAAFLAQVLSVMCACLLFGGSALDILVTGALGVVIALLPFALARASSDSKLFVPGAAFIAGLVATALARLGAPIEPDRVVLASLIVLVPGYGLTVAVQELATGHLVSGTARMASVIGTLLGMGLGVGLGRALSDAIPTLDALSHWIDLPLSDPRFALLVVPLVPLCFVVLFQARVRDTLAITLVAVAAYAGARYAGLGLGPELAAFAGALILGLGSNLDGRLRRIPATVVQAPGLMLLVPGSIGFRSVEAFLGHDALSGVDVAFRAALIAWALVAGLLTANLVVPPRSQL